METAYLRWPRSFSYLSVVSVVLEGVGPRGALTAHSGLLGMDAGLHFPSGGSLPTIDTAFFLRAMPLAINNLETESNLSAPPRGQASSPQCNSLHIAEVDADSRPHILYIIDALCVMGGTERVLFNMIRRLPKDRFRCSLVTFKIDNRTVSTGEIDCPVYILPLKKTYDLTAFRAAKALRNLIRKERIAIVHTFFETSDLWASPIARLSGCPILISSRRDLGISRTLKHWLGYRLLHSMYDLVLAVSPQVRDFCINVDHANPATVRTLFNGVDVKAIPQIQSRSGARRATGVSEHAPVITTVANIRKVKGLDVLVEAAHLVCSRHPEALFLIVGKELESEYFQELQAQTAILGLADNVKFLGPCEDAFPILAMSDAFCLPSRSEGFSNALIEAMAAGLPCVATDVGGNREVVKDGESGFIVESEDWRALAGRLTSLLDDPARARIMGKRAQEIARTRFTLEGMMKELVEVYDVMIAEKGCAPCMARR
jgi:glycosyltransferase involved in cell wall biosynthesis